MTADDLAASERVSAAAFGFEIGAEPVAARWHRRHAHLLATDPDGCFVAEHDGAVVGVAQAMLRERLWCLSLLTVDPGAQSAGAGRALFEAALSYGRREADGALIVGSNDPRAMQLYGNAGFRLLPTFVATGTLHRRALPRADARVREAGAGDLEALAVISRAVRGAPHTLELEFVLGGDARILRFGDRGFTVADPFHNPWLLVALDEEAATALLWASLTLPSASEERAVRWLTGEQEWAIAVMLRAGLALRAEGALCVRGDPGPLHPFLPSPPFA